MSHLLRTLLIEDSEDDAELTIRNLRRGGYEVQVERIETAAALDTALVPGKWDIVICDYVLPGFGGLEALALFKRKGLDIPFIVVSGHIGEDIAVEAMRAGAHDYIMKDKMVRLVPAVARELRESAIRQARMESESALRESEERFRQLADNIDVAFFMFDRPDADGNSRVLYASRAYEGIWGRSLASLYQDGQSWLKSIHPEDKAIFKDLPPLNHGKFNHELRIVGQGTKIRWINYRTFPVFDENGEVCRIAAIAEDITRRKEAEEQLVANSRQLQDMVEEMQAIEDELRETNAALLESRTQLERRVQQRTADLTIANSELQRQMIERTRLERELLEIADKERRRIGFDLHDDVSQKLLGISFMIKALERKVANKKLPPAAETHQIQVLIDEVVNHTRSLSHDFSSLDVAGGDIASELKTLVAGVRKMFQISCQFVSKGRAPALQQNMTVQLYKIAQEAVSNAVKHGKASEVMLSLACVPGKLVLTIKNDGLPFPKEKITSDGIGLRIMSSRASLIGATFEIQPLKDGGAAVICTLPLINGFEDHSNGDSLKNSEHLIAPARELTATQAATH